MPRYYPSALAQLYIRLDEGVGQIPPEALAVLRGQAAATDAVGLKAFAMPIQDGYSHITAVQPHTLDLELNSHRIADTLGMTIAWRDFPLPSRMLRNVGIMIYAGTVSSDDYAAGLGAAAAGARTQNIAIVKPTRKSLRFVGFADDVAEDHQAGTVSFRCRDYTGILLDTELAAAVYDVDVNAPLDDVITKILATVPGDAAKHLNVVNPPYLRADSDTYRFTDAPLPTVALITPAATRRRKGKLWRLSPAMTGPETKYWDLITDICVQAGFVPIVDRNELQITTPRNILGREAPGSFLRVVNGKPLQIRRMIHGFNIETLRTTRKFGRLAAPSIQVRSAVPGRAAPLIAEWPPPKNPKRRATSVMPSGRGAAGRVETFVVKGVSNPDTLRQVAAGLYEELGRGEYGGRMETYELASTGGTNLDPDLLDVKSGDPLEIVVEARGLTTGLCNYLSDAQSPAAMMDRLRVKGWNDAVAAGIVNLYLASKGLQTVFRVRDVRQSWRLAGDNPGVRLGFTFGTYLETRNDPVGAVPVPASTASPRVQVVG